MKERPYPGLDKKERKGLPRDYGKTIARKLQVSRSLVYKVAQGWWHHHDIMVELKDLSHDES